MRRKALSSTQAIEASQPELVGAHGCRRGAIGEQVELTPLDAVLHLAASPIDLLVEILAADLCRPQRGNDTARIGLATRDFGVAHDASAAAPTVQRRPGEV